MKLIARPIVAALLLLIALTITTVAQQKRQTPARPKPTPAPTFDTLIPAEGYTMYGEVRGVGQLVKSSAITEALDPILKLSGPPKEFKTIVKWLNAHADELMTSRLLVATWAADKTFPEAVVAIEFASAEEAAKFEASLNSVLKKVLPPSAQVDPDSKGENPKTTAPPRPNFYVQQAGSLILLTPTPLSLKKLKPAGSKLLSDDPNFRAARNRFSSEPIFVFINSKLLERRESEQRKLTEAALLEHERLQIEKAEEADKSEDPTSPEEAGHVPFQHTELVVDVTPEFAKKNATPDLIGMAVTSIGASLFDGQSKWPDGFGLALTFENDSFDLRALLINEPGEKSDTVPFMPMLIPGPPIVPESPNILPADTQMFATMSLDLPQIYAAMTKPRPNSMVYRSRGVNQTVEEVVHQSPFAAIEESLKLKLKDDVLPLLGSEITLRLPVTGLDLVGLPRGPVPESANKPDQSVGASPVVLISLRDKEGVRALMPKIVEAMGFKGASSLAQTERKEDTELISYLNFFSYAFIGNFLVISADAATVKHVVNSYLKHETLGSDGTFKNATRWQPRPTHGVLYVSPALMESYKTWAEQTKQISDPTREFLTRLASVAQPISYSLSNEGFGPLHEVHLPRSLVMMAIAGISGEGNPPPERQNEAMAQGLMYTIAHVQEQYKKDKGAGSYGTLEQLFELGVLPKEMLENSGYKFDLIVTGDKFQVTAVPVEYGKNGKMSYFIDQTRVLRGVDRQGAAATSSDPAVY